MLHELVARHAQSLLAELRDADPDGGSVPRYVERELAAYAMTGILSHGFTRVRCPTCHDEIVVAFNCKRRGLYLVSEVDAVADTFFGAHVPVRRLSTHNCPWSGDIGWHVAFPESRAGECTVLLRESVEDLGELDLVAPVLVE